MRKTTAISRQRDGRQRRECQCSPRSATTHVSPGILWEQGVAGSNPAAPIEETPCGTKQGLSRALGRCSLFGQRRHV
jgi:hypothetical protein